jgi:hypothetical protein
MRDVRTYNYCCCYTRKPLVWLDAAAAAWNSTTIMAVAAVQSVLMTLLAN